MPELVDPVDPMVVYGDLPVARGRPAVRLNMIASVDGATTVAGLSGGLGGPADKRVFSVLRSLADAVLVAARTVLAEGGPSLNGQLAAAGLIDELCLSLSPALVGGDSKRILSGPTLEMPARCELRSVCEDDGYLFLRYRSSP